MVASKSLFGTLELLLASLVLMSCNLTSTQGLTRPLTTPAPASISAASSSELPSFVTNACTQTRTVGNSFFGQRMERICTNFDKNSFEANLGAVLGTMHDPVNGISGVNPATGANARATAEFTEFVMVCGREPYPSDATVHSRRQNTMVACATFASDYKISDTTQLYEWWVYQNLLKPFLLKNPANTPALLDSYIHMLRAEDIMRFQLRGIAGCTGDARVFVVLARSLNLSVRYVATVSVDDYLNTCCKNGDGNQIDCTGHKPVKPFSSGHQVAAIKMPSGKWRILNTSLGGPDSHGVLPWALDESRNNQPLEADDPSQFVGRYATFVIDTGSQLLTARNMVTAVEDDQYFDNLALDIPNTLTQLYASGKRSDPICKFNPL